MKHNELGHTFEDSIENMRRDILDRIHEMRGNDLGDWFCIACLGNSDNENPLIEVATGIRMCEKCLERCLADAREL